MKKIIFVFTVVLISFSAFCQSKKLIIHTQLGLSFPGTGELNDALEANGHIASSKAFFSRGAGIYTAFPKARIATMASFSSYAGNNNDAQKSTALRGTQIGTAIGALLLRESSVQLIPYVGLAYSFFGVRTASTTPTNGIGFGDYLSGSPNQHYLSSNQWLGNVGIQFTKEGVGDSKLGQKLVLGLKAGHYLTLGDSKWKTNDVNIEGGPNVNTGGFYAGVIVGFIQ